MMDVRGKGTKEGAAVVGRKTVGSCDTISCIESSEQSAPATLATVGKSCGCCFAWLASRGRKAGRKKEVRLVAPGVSSGLSFMKAKEVLQMSHLDGWVVKAKLKTTTSVTATTKITAEHQRHRRQSQVKHATVPLHFVKLVVLCGTGAVRVSYRRRRGISGGRG